MSLSRAQQLQKAFTFGYKDGRAGIKAFTGIDPAIWTDAWGYKGPDGKHYEIISVNEFREMYTDGHRVGTAAKARGEKAVEAMGATP